MGSHPVIVFLWYHIQIKKKPYALSTHGLQPRGKGSDMKPKTQKAHDEGWVIVASSSEEASKYHEDMEGYEPGDAKAEEILDIPEKVPAETGWPSDELLLAVGAKFLLNDQSRVVEIAGRKFCEGMLEAILNEINDDAFEERGDARLNNTKKPPLH